MSKGNSTKSGNSAEDKTNGIKTSNQESPSDASKGNEEPKDLETPSKESPSGAMMPLINKNSNKDNTQDKTKQNGIIIMPNVGTRVSTSEKEDQKNDEKPSSEKDPNTPEKESAKNKDVDKTNESDKTEQKSEETKSKQKNQDPKAISGLMGLLGNLVKNKLQNKLNGTGSGPNVGVGDSSSKAKQDLDKNITIGKINISLQSVDKPPPLESNDQSSGANLRYHPTVSMNTVNFKAVGSPLNKEKSNEDVGRDSGSKVDANPSANDQKPPKEDQTADGNDSQSSKQGPIPIMRIRLKGPSSNADEASKESKDEPLNNKEIQSSIIANSLKTNSASLKDEGELKKPLHTTTVIIRQYKKDPKTVSYGTEDQFDTLPMRGSENFDAFGNRKLPSPVISMNDAEQMLEGDKELLDNTAFQNALFNPEAATFANHKTHGMKLAQHAISGPEIGQGGDEDFAKALQHQEDPPKLPPKMSSPQRISSHQNMAANAQMGQIQATLPNEKPHALSGHRFKDAGHGTQVSRPHNPVMTGYNDYGPDQMGNGNHGDFGNMPSQPAMNDAPMGMSLGNGVQMAGAGGGGGQQNMMPVEMRPIKGNEQDVQNTMKQALSNMQDMAMKQIQSKYPGMQITMKQSDEGEEGDEEQQQEQQQGDKNLSDLFAITYSHSKYVNIRLFLFSLSQQKQ